MASSARIDELRKKFDENPRRYFAPLANEYRKAGDLEQAIFICEEYLPQQPGHMSGHIVYGQALFELNRHDEAKIVFETALSLDPENLIALRHLGDIARQAGDTNSARIWYQRVLEADPRNEEIAQIMLSLLSADPTASPPRPTPSATAAVDHNAPTPLSTAAVPPPIPQAPPPATEPPPLPTAAASPEPAPSAPAPKEEELLDMSSFDLGGVSLSMLRQSKPVPVQADEPAEPVAASSQSAPLDAAGDESGGGDDVFESGFDLPAATPAPPAASAAAAPVAATPVSLDALQGDSRVTDEPDAFEADPFAVGDAGLETPPAPQPLIELGPDVILGLPSDSPGETAVEAEVLDGLQSFETGVIRDKPAETISLETESFFDLPDASAPAPSDDAAESLGTETASEGDGGEATEVFVTETMATLYLQQGHLDSALDIYRKLIEQRPDDDALRGRYQAVEAQLYGAAGGESDDAYDAGDETIDEPIGATAQSYGGPTIREFLGGLVRPMAATERDPEPAPEATPSLEATSTVDDGGIELEVEELAPPHRASGPIVKPTPSTSDSVGGSLGALFSGADAAATDATAANTLAQAFAPDSPETAPLRGMPAHRASDELSLDHVFKGGAPSRPANEKDNFSFDQFFSEDAAGRSDTATPESAGPASQAPDDIAQFNAWLNGLKKS